MKILTIAILALAVVGLLFVSGCATGQAYNPPSGPVGGGCGVGAPVGADGCADGPSGDAPSESSTVQL